MSKYDDEAKRLGELVTEKNAAYGSSFEKSEGFLRILYPNGVQPNQMGDMLTVARVIDKLFRIATRKDAFGESPWNDIMGYGLLMSVYDREAKERAGQAPAKPPAAPQVVIADVRPIEPACDGCGLKQRAAAEGARHSSECHACMVCGRVNQHAAGCSQTNVPLLFQQPYAVRDACAGCGLTGDEARGGRDHSPLCTACRICGSEQGNHTNLCPNSRQRPLPAGLRFVPSDPPPTAQVMAGIAAIQDQINEALKQEAAQAVENLRTNAETQTVQTAEVDKVISNGSLI